MHAFPGETISLHIEPRSLSQIYCKQPGYRQDICRIFMTAYIFNLFAIFSPPDLAYGVVILKLIT